MLEREMTRGIMEVTVVRARDLKNTEFFGKVDPYILIEYKNEKQKSTTGHKKTLKSRLQCCCVCVQGQGARRPTWNEKFNFKVEYPVQVSEKEPQPKLHLKIMDHDSFTNDDCLGQTTIYLKELFELGAENKNGRAEFPIQKYRVVSSDKTYRGEIQVGVIFTVNGQTDQQENGGSKKQN